MKDFTELHKVINDRVINEAAYYLPEPWWDAEVAAFSKDVPLSIQFIAKECSDEELYWLSEIFDFIIEETLSVKLYKTIEERITRVENDEYREEMQDCLKDADYFIEDKL